jgi:type II secretory pathway pseudopilin PulG
MDRFSDQRGSTLILVIGVIATLAVLASTLVLVTANAMQGTAKDRERAQAFNLAEGALDKAMNVLAADWPSSDSIHPRVDPAQFWSEFATPSPLPTPASAIADQFAAPAAGDSRVEVDIYDNTTAKDYWDKNGDSLMWVEAQGNVGKVHARVRAQVYLSPADLGLVPNQAVYTPGSAELGAGASVTAEVLAPGTTSVGIFCKNPDDVAKKQLPDQVKTYNSAGVDGGLSPGVLGYLKSLAQSSTSSKRYFTASDWTTFAKASPDMGGVFYVDSPSAEVKWPAAFNPLTGDGVMPDLTSGIVHQPCLLIVNAPSLKWEANLDFYGLVYCTGTVDFQGTPNIHGLLIAGSSSSSPPAVSISGNYGLMYNDTVRQNLNSAFSMNVKIVKDTWQEIQPK